MAFSEDEKKVAALARQVMDLARDELLIHLRFLDGAFSGVALTERFGLEGMAGNGRELLYDPVTVLRWYRTDPRLPGRVLLHSLLHNVFSHSFAYEKLDTELWDLAADIAAEAVILELGLEAASLDTDGELQGKLRVLREDAGALSAEKLYGFFRKNPPSVRVREEYARAFAKDLHLLWKEGERYELTKEQWQQISRRIRAELKSFSKGKGMGELLQKGLEEADRDSYDYGQILSRFAVTGEQTHVNEEEFDYIYYTYGLETYGNLPLVEPLEYREERKVREFVIALDTSASCNGDVIRGFLKRTVSLLFSGESFFRKVNIRILQCDSEIRSETKISEMGDLKEFLKDFRVSGGGATDFRPVFAHVEELREAGEFENLKGLIYFTDGYGIYPSQMPDYEVLFAFLGEDPMRGPVPPWALKAVFEEDQLLKAEKESV